MRKLLILIGITTLLIPNLGLAEAEFIGGLRNVVGDAVVKRGEREISAKNGLRIYLNDVLVTHAKGSMGIIFKDDTRISLGPDSQLEVTQYVYSPAKEKFGFITNMIKGTASYISGAIGKASPEAVKFETPVATIGIRGTTFLAKVAP